MTEIPSTKKSTKRRWILWWGALAALVAVLLISLMVNVVLFFSQAFSGSGSSGGKGEDEFPSFTEVHSYGSGRTKVVRISMQGTIFRQAGGGLFSSGYDPVAMVLAQIQAARNDKAVKGILLEVDSPGGAVTPSDEIYTALVRFRDSREDRKVLVFTRDMAASGGYYIAAAGDWIIAEPTAILGSIGVIMQAMNWKELTDWVGIDSTTIKSGGNKDLLNPFEEVNPAQVEILQSMVDSMYRRFFDIVKTERGLEEDALAAVADGRVLDADQSLEAGLIDEIGYWSEAVERMTTLLDVSSVKIVRYSSTRSLSDLLLQLRSPDQALRATLGEANRPRFLYLWRP